MEIGSGPDQVQGRRADVFTLPADLRLDLAKLEFDHFHVRSSLSSVQTDQGLPCLIVSADRGQPTGRVGEEEHSSEEDDRRNDLDGQGNPPLRVGCSKRLASESFCGGSTSDRREFD